MLLPLFLTMAIRLAQPVFDLSGWTAAPRAEKESVAPEAAAEIRAAGRDVARLVRLAETYQSRNDEAAARAAWSAVLAVDAAHEAAHEGLRHHAYDGRWFETYAALSEYQREEARRMLAEKGLVRFGEQWVPEADVVFLRMGWTRGGDGAWLRAGEPEQRAREAQLAADGWQRQDATWIAPEDFPKWREGLWKCGGEWLATEAADAWHAAIDRGWTVPGERFDVTSTCARATVQAAVWHADRVVPDLVRIFGVEPGRRPEVVVLNGIDQYNLFAGGDGEGRAPTEQTGHSSVHFAYFAESSFDFSAAPPRWRGAGVAYWDAGDPKLAPFGLHAVRHAAAQAWIDALDPSWQVVAAVVTSPGAPLRSADFWAAKKIPLWLRFGAASYVERFFLDDQVGAGGDPAWARTWAIANLARQGGLEPLVDVFEFDLDPADPERAGRRIAGAGLIVAFVLDGGCAPVAAAHAALREALRDHGDVAAAARGLEQALVANRAKLEAFAKR